MPAWIEGMKKRTVLIVTGPTGVGKTDFVDELSAECSLEIINGDMGQMYVPLSIGTAKPCMEQSAVPHHLFNILSEPTYFSAMKYRNRVDALVKEIWDRDRVPVIVGGSSFYLLSLFFPTIEDDHEIVLHQYEGKDLWEQLHRIDPERAQAIHPQDTYRLERALALWQSTGKKPSLYKPSFDPFAACTIIWLERDREDLYDRINARVINMLNTGWIEEVKRLVSTSWEQFLKKKKIIGYDILFEYLAGGMDIEQLMRDIQKKTRNYAKRQMTFWRSFKRKLIQGYDSLKSGTKMPLTIVELNLTHDDIESYIKQLKNDICS